jgi:NAD(P)-dependent dehydrogenase (short-subunit alcohol dehydrogenase family)
VRVVVVGASSGLGRCIGIGMAQRGAEVALLGRRLERIEEAAEDAGSMAFAVECDATEAASCGSAIDTAAGKLGGIDALVYAPGVAPLVRIEAVDRATWEHAFATNVIGASLVTAAALPHLAESSGHAAYLSSVSASQTPPWPGLGAYAVTKAALDKLVEAWRAEHPEVGFTRLVVGDCAGGEGHGTTEITGTWDQDLAVEVAPIWVERGYLAGALIEVDALVNAIDSVLRSGPTLSLPTVVLTPRAGGLAVPDLEGLEDLAPRD